MNALAKTLLLSAVYRIAICTEIHVSLASELISISSSVTLQNTYLGTTVVLDADISFTEAEFYKFKPIGASGFNAFFGDFDGKGHVISHLTLNGTDMVGLFGVIKGSTIRNFVLDQTCSIKSSCDSKNVYVGGAVGLCDSTDNSSVIENIVNMANITFLGKKSSYIYIGGIVGFMYSYKYDSAVRNCVNYGYVLSEGDEGNLFIGGIIGNIEKNIITYTQNCLNYGIVHSKGDKKYVVIGGIVGYSGSSEVENCVSAGKQLSESDTLCMGSIVGTHGGTKELEIKHCFWMNEIGHSNPYGSSLTNVSVVHSFSVKTLNKTALVELNEYAKANNTWSSWLMLHLNEGVINGISQETPTVMHKYFPDPVKLGYNFLNWCLDAECTKTYDPKAASIANVSDVYANFSVISYVITFCWDEVTETREFNYNEEIKYPNDPEKPGHTFREWNPKPVYMPANNITIRAIFSQNTYVVTYNTTGGDPISENKSVTYGMEYGELKTPTKTGCKFLWWYDINGVMVTSKTKVNISEDHVLYAGWDITTVTFDAGEGRVSVLLKNVTYGEPYGTLPTPKQSGWVFEGWYIGEIEDGNKITSETTVFIIWDHTLYAKWTQSTSDSSSKLVTGLVVSFTVLFVLALAVVFFLIKKKGNCNWSMRRSNLEMPLVSNEDEINSDDDDNDDDDFDEYGRVRSNNVSSTVNQSPSEISLGIFKKTYSAGYARPTMKTALTEAGLIEAQSDMVCKACASVGQFAKENGLLSGDFTEEDAAAVAMYTYDFGPGKFESNPYRIINKSLIERNFNILQSASGLLYLVMTALRKLPRVTGMTLYRGIQSKIKIDMSHYHEGNTVTWSALSSTSPDMKATKAFLAKGSKTGEAKGTLFIIENSWGYNIQPYSLFPDETEILLEPDRQFKVMSVIPSSGLAVINLKMLDTPLVLPDVFGVPK